MSEPCAVWYWHRSTEDYEMCASERAAADWAVRTEWYGEYNVAGVQFADGRVLRWEQFPEQWPEYAAAEQRWYDERKRRIAESASRPRKPVRTIRSPFSGERVEVAADEPSWLGAVGE